METEISAPKAANLWQKTKHTNLLRYVPSGVYFARFKVKGKLIRKSLKTDVLTVAVLRLSDLEKTEKQKADTVVNAGRGKMTFGEALEICKQRLKDDIGIKDRTRDYYDQRIIALLKSWPGIEGRDVARFSPAECKEWSLKFTKDNSSSSHNHTVGILRKVFAIAMESGARYDNPALAAQRVKERTTKQIILPEFGQFKKIVNAVRQSGSGFSKPASQLIQFLAYGGFRKGEARFITWSDCNFNRGEITVRGNPETGLKGRNVGESRFVPMIPDMKRLLKAIRAERPQEAPEIPVMRVAECQKSIDRASLVLGIARITHHDLRHLFATRCIESGVDIPTVSRWLGHKDGGALAMKIYGHLRNEHSQKMAQKVRFSSGKT